MTKSTICLLIVLATLLSGTKAWADEGEQLAFDIFDNHGMLSVWLDLSPLITAKRLSDIKDGIDLAVDCRLSLYRPRRLWGAEKVKQATVVYRIGYRLVADDFQISCRTDSASLERRFLSPDTMNRFLGDSITVDLASMAPLDVSKHYYVDVKITCVSLTVLNVAESDEPSETDKSAIKWLFEGFLDLTNFGRQDYELRSRLFSLSELSPSNN